MLAGVRVLDFSWVLAGPYATRILADFGAEVIKVQSARIARATEDAASGYFAAWNRNKKSVTLDLERAEARRLALALAAVSDVVVENFSPRVMRSWGLSYPEIRAVNPTVVMLSMSTAGHGGAGEELVGFAPTVHALSGLTRLTSFTPAEPLGPGVPHGDIVAGLYGALAVLAALEHRAVTGRGQHIDLSHYEAVCAMLGPELARASLDGSPGDPVGNGPGETMAAPHGCYPCRGEDRWCVIAVFDDAEWVALCRVMGDPPWTSAFRDIAERRRRAAELDARIGEWTIGHTAEELVALLQRAGVPAGVVQDAADLVRDPHLNARGFFRHLPHPRLGEMLTDASPIVIDGERGCAWEPAPGLGEHNRYVFQELLGLPEAEVAAHVRNGVIR